MFHAYYIQKTDKLVKLMIIKLFSKSKLVTERCTQPSIWFLFCIPLCSACCAGISSMHALLIFKRLTTQLIETNCGVYFWSNELVQKWWDAWKVCMRKLSHVWECRMESSQISLNVGTVWDKAVCVARAFLLFFFFFNFLLMKWPRKY